MNVARNLFFSKAYAVVEGFFSFAAAPGAAWIFLGFGAVFASVGGLASDLALALPVGFTFVGFCGQREAFAGDNSQ